MFGTIDEVIEETNANAALIAAAPELVAACRKALEYAENSLASQVERRNVVEELYRVLHRAGCL